MIKMPLEWFKCLICGNKCSIIPLSVLFDIEGKQYGGLWYCETCRKYFTDYFLTFSQIEQLKKSDNNE
jgi:hypothetical protein